VISQELNVLTNAGSVSHSSSFISSDCLNNFHNNT
jgi:hypothetical protein